VSQRWGLGATVVAIGFFGSTSVAFAQAEAAPAPLSAACGEQKFLKKAEKNMRAADKASTDKKWDEVLAQVREAEAVEGEKNEWHKFWVHEYSGMSYVNLKKYPEAEREFDLALNSPCMPEAQKANRYKVLLQLAYQNKNYPKAIEYGNLAVKAGGDSDLLVYVGNAYYIQNDNENTRRVMADLIKAQEAKGAKPEEQTYRILQSACSNLKDNACVIDQFEKLVAHYPKPDYWTSLIGSMLREGKNDKQLLSVLRLAKGSDVLTEADQYYEMSRLALDQGLPGEAQTTVEEGFQKGIFKDAREKDRNTRLLEEAKKAAAYDKTTIDKQDASAKAKPTGDSDVKLGAAYLSYSQPEKAIEAIKRGVAKGGVKDPDEAGLLLGMAYLRTGNKAEAANAFRTVTQNPLMVRVAKLWLLKTV
jgi:tetratricopeptide (TPR) repeat protein